GVRHLVTGNVPDITGQFACDGGHDRLDLFALLEHGVILLTETFLRRLGACFCIVGRIRDFARCK
ncbi:MAG: hypothetical protein OXG05_15430, partial [Gammaproteobacteria bacterium]|nr:hypothetical protein [Gammaproteobacteria bacterium]